MFVESRDQSRQFFFQVWEKMARGEVLSPLEALIAEVIRAHPEYHVVLGQGERAVERDFGGGQANPFLHMGLHVALIEQLQTDRPAGITALYRQLVNEAGHDVHGLEHRIMGGWLPIVVIRFHIMFAHRVTFKFIPHQDAA